MRIIDRYIARSFLIAFVVTLGVFTFVMSLGVIFRITDLLARGGSWAVVARIFIWGVPAALSFATPISVMVASLLVFSRLAADHEITAMKACGIGIWDIVTWPLLMSCALGAACLIANAELIPACHYKQRTAIKSIGVSDALALIEEGRFIRDFPGLSVYIGHKDGDSIRNIIIYETSGGRVKRTIKAQSGTLRKDDSEEAILLDLRDVKVDPLYENGRMGAPGYCRSFPKKIPFKAADGNVSKRESDFSFSELLERVHLPELFFSGVPAEESRAERMELIVECHKRVTLALSCLAFVMIGVPMGIRTHRQESTIGIAISLSMVLISYVFVIIAKTLARHVEFHSYVFLWIPVVLCVGAGIWLMRRAD